MVGQIENEKVEKKTWAEYGNEIRLLQESQTETTAIAKIDPMRYIQYLCVDMGLSVIYCAFAEFSWQCHNLCSYNNNGDDIDNKLLQ